MKKLSIIFLLTISLNIYSQGYDFEKKIFGYSLDQITMITNDVDSTFYIDDLNLVDELSTIGLENLNSSVLTVVPNPSNGSFSVDLSGVMLSKAKLTLMDMTGTIVFSESIASDASIQNIESRLGTGMYILKITGSQQEWIEKIVIK